MLYDYKILMLVVGYRHNPSIGLGNMGSYGK